MQCPSPFSPLFCFYGRTQEQGFLPVEIFSTVLRQKNVYLRIFGQWMKDLRFCHEHVRCLECEEISSKSSLTHFFCPFKFIWEWVISCTFLFFVVEDRTNNTVVFFFLIIYIF